MGFLISSAVVEVFLIFRSQFTSEAMLDAGQIMFRSKSEIQSRPAGPQSYRQGAVKHG